MSITRLNLDSLVNNGTTSLLGGGSLFTTGKVFYVNSVIGSDGNLGTDPEAPKATVNGAVAAVRANKGDKIVLMPNHAEDVANATDFLVDKAGTDIIGLGRGTDRATFTFTNTAGSVEMDAADCGISNVVFNASVSAVVVGINIDAANISIVNCETGFDATGDDFITMIDVDGVNGTSLIGNKLIAEDTAGCAEAIRLDDCDDTTIEGNTLYGDFTDGAIIGEGAAGKNLQLSYNTIYNSDTTAGFVIDLNVAFTGVMAYNNCTTLFATAPETALDPGSMLCIENYVANAVDESGALVPTAVST